MRRRVYPLVAPGLHDLLRERARVREHDLVAAGKPDEAWR
jgi:hypothetical protein